MIQSCCEYYLFIEPSPDTHMADSPLYQRMNYLQELDGMEVVHSIERIEWDKYTAGLLRRVPR